MICKNCGKELQDGVKFCAFCGTKVEEPVIAEEPVAVETPVTPNEVPEINEEPIAPKKKKGVLKGIIISVVAVVAVLGITVAAAFPYVKDFVERTLLPAEKYYQSVENKNVDKVQEGVVTAFDSVKESAKVLKKNYDSLRQGKLVAANDELENKNVSAELSITLGDPIMSLLKSSGMNLDVMKKIALGIDVSSKDGLSSSDLTLGLSDKDVITINAVVDSEGVAYVSYPELSDTAMKMNFAELLGFEDIGELYSSAEIEEAYGVLFDVIDALPDGKTASKIISRYADVALSEVDDADKSKETLSVGETEVKATAIEVTLDEKSLKNIALALIEEFEDDEELMAIVDEVVAATGYAEKGEIKEQLENAEFFDYADEMLEEVLDGFGEIVLTVFVDSKGITLGRKIEYQDFTVNVLCLEKGKNTAFEVSVESADIGFSIVGEGTLKKNIFNGEVNIEAMGQALATVNVADFDTEKPMNGTFTVKPSKMISSLISNYETDDIEETFGMSLKDMGIDLSDISLVLDMKSDDETASFSLDLLTGKTSVIKLGVSSLIEDAKSIKIPEKAMAITSEEDVEAWASTLDLEGFIASLPEELQGIATLLTQSGMFGGSEDVAEPNYGYEDEWNYEDYVSDSGLSETLDVATSADFPPFEYYDGEYITGFDIDLGMLIAEYLGMDHAVYNMTFDEIVPSVAEGAYDVGIAAITATEERLIDVNFSVPYIANTQVVIMREDSPLVYLTDLYEEGASHVVGVKTGTTADNYATSDFGSERVVYYAEYEDTLAGLLEGQVDYIIVDYPVANMFLEQNTGIKRLAEDFSFEEYCIAVSKENDELLFAINEAIEALRQNGTIEYIYNAYIFGYVEEGEEIPDGFEVMEGPLQYATEYDYSKEFMQGVLEGMLNYDNGADYNTSGTPATMFDSAIDLDGVYDNFGYETTPSYTAPTEKVMDDYYYNDYYYGRQSTEDYFEDYGY